MVDFSKLQSGEPGPVIVDPIELFQSLKVTDSGINDLWLAQGDALREWQERRDRGDVAIVLNTGAGKTLVGLVAAQSLVHETRQHVLYACASIQLVEQTAQKAAGYGLDVTTYVRGDFDNDLYFEGKAPCITTYHALFNGRTRFRREELSAVVFDDAHAATHIIRDQFTLTIDRYDRSKTFDELATVFGGYFGRVHADVGFRQAMDNQDPFQRWFVPPFVLRESLGEVKRILLDAHLESPNDTKFQWAHLADRLDLCAVFISGTMVAFTPPVVPINTMPYFREGIRRLYLSASLASDDVFVRTFGRAPDHVIAPRTSAGECERMVLVPRLHEACDNDIAVAKGIVAGEKALVLVPTHRSGEEWDDLVGQNFGESDTTGQVERFKAAPAPAALRLVCRYDGIDLPGDTCRMMVIDGLPSGLGPLERYLWEQLAVARVLRSTVASRIVQSFGRISRGMTDHGVVILTGEQLVKWLLSPTNRASLPPFLRHQIELGLELSREVSPEDAPGTAQQCIGRDAGWIEYYERVMREQTTEAADDGHAARDAAAIEVAFGHALWNRDYASAAKTLEDRREGIMEFSGKFGAWLLLWEGYAHELLGDEETARDYYRRAHSLERMIPPHPDGLGGSGADLPEQALSVARCLYGQPDTLARFDRDLVALNGRASARKTEEAVRRLGSYLGLRASRPDQEHGTGPDVLWFLPGLVAWAMELKTDKESPGAYSKREIMQVADHVRWTADNAETSSIVPMIVGPVLPADSKANPTPETVIVELAEIRELRDRLRAALEDILQRALPLTLPQVVQEVFSQRGLEWSELVDSVRGTPVDQITPASATELQGESP